MWLWVDKGSGCVKFELCIKYSIDRYQLGLGWVLDL